MRNTYVLLKYCALLTLCLYHSTRAAVFNLTILHTNDCHARFVETDQNGRICTADTADCFGGVARRATAVNEARARDPDGHVLFLDAGDQFQGTDWFYTYRGNATAHFMNLLGYDAMVSTFQSSQVRVYFVFKQFFLPQEHLLTKLFTNKFRPIRKSI